MNARVFLLILVTGLFMAAWNGDQAAMSEALARRQQAAGPPAADAGSSRTLHVQHPGAHLAGHSRTSAPSAPAGAAIPAFRPAGMAAGRYRVLNELGDTMEIRVEEATNYPPRDYYVGDSPDGLRWHFIRLRDAE